VVDDIQYITDSQYQYWLEGEPQSLSVTRVHGKAAIDVALARYNQHHMLTDQSPRHVIRAGGAIVVPVGAHTHSLVNAITALNLAKDNIHEFLNQRIELANGEVGESRFDRHQKKQFVEQAIGKATQLMQLYRHIPLITKPVRSISYSWLTKDVTELLSPEEFVARYQDSSLPTLSKQIIDEHIALIVQGRAQFDAFQRYKVQQAANMATITYTDNTRSKMHVSLPLVLCGNEAGDDIVIHPMKDYHPDMAKARNKLKATKRYTRHSLGLDKIIGLRYR
jgi:hypothetical protein